MLEERTGFCFLLSATERCHPDVQISIVGDLGVVGNELPVRRPVGRKLRTFGVEHAACRSPAPRPAEKAHAAVSTAAEQNLAGGPSPNGTEFRYGKIRIRDTKDGPFAEQVYHPYRWQDFARIIMPVYRLLSFIRRNADL